jgi:TB2/DP1, HVA22 family
MREIPSDKIALYAATIAVAAALTPIISKFRRTKGKNLVSHLIYVIASALIVAFVPEWVQHDLLSPGGVLLIGTFIPIYESIVAVCSVSSTDATSWLQFWIASGTFSFATEFMDEITAHLPNAGEHWYEFEFFFTAWLMLPFTDGSGLLYENLTKPYLIPTIEKLKIKLEGWAQLILLSVNSYYMWIMWYAFIRLTEDERRFLVVGLGTVYPMTASLASLAATNEKTRDERFWLTYWVCYSLLFTWMDYAENFIGSIPGFYSICAAATLYLFLPMFQGADAIFRNVLVPLSGQRENLILYDAYMVKLSIERAIPLAQRDQVMSKAAELFQKSKSK